MKKISESAWGDMMKRSSGEIIRKEDDVNLLDIDGLYDYIKSKYEKRIFYLDKYRGKFNLWEICVDIIGNISLKAIYNENGEINHIVLSWSGVGVKIRHSFLWVLSEKFNVENVGTCRRVIKEKDDTCTNKTYIDVIDFFLENMDNIVVNESAWGDMMRRSSGEIIRREDEVPQKIQKALASYIDMFASIAYTGDYTVGSYSEFQAFVKDFKDKPRVSSLDYDMEDLLDYTKEHWDDTVLPAIEDAIDNLNKQIDDIVDDLNSQNVNESAWGDMMRRSSGDIIRKEEFTEEFIDKVRSKLIGFVMSVVYYIKNYELTFDGFYKYLEEIESPDEIKKIIYYVKTNKNEFDKLLEKDIKSENKYLDEKVNGYLLRFVDNIVYDEKYHNTFSDIKKFASEIFKGHKSSYHFNINEKLVFKDKSELFNDYIEDKWKNGSLKQKIDDLIKNENDEISKYGFVKEPGKTISETIDDWWDSLDEAERNDLGWDEFGDDAEEEYYADHNPKYNEYTGEDFDVDEWWANAWGIRRVKIYCSEHSKTNESAWGDMMRRSSGESVRKEDDLTFDDIKFIVKSFIDRIVYFEEYKNKIDDLEDLIERSWRLPDRKDAKEMARKQIGYVRRNWQKIEKIIDDGVNELEKNIKRIGFVKKAGESPYDTLYSWWDSLDKKIQKEIIDSLEDDDYDDYDDPKDIWESLSWDDQMIIYVKWSNAENVIKEELKESAWGDMMRRSSGESVRKEDILDDNEIHAANELITMYCRQERVNYIQHKIVPPPPSVRKENDLLGLVKYIEGWRDQDSFKDIDYNKIIRYIKNNWERLDIDKFIKKWIFSPETMEGKKVFECEGVPGGATPASVGGMGAAYFPGADGTPGSGDLPSPTGIVYHQVAPYTMFLKQIKKKKKKSKKFRKEDEPCVHSPNAKVYDYVDDFREYVDRTYNNIDRRK